VRRRPGPAEPPRCPGASRGSFDLAVSRRRGRDERVEELSRCCCNLIHRALEGSLVDLRRLIAAAEFSDELEGRSPDFLVVGGRLEIEEGLDVPAHDVLHFTLGHFIPQDTPFHGQSQRPLPLTGEATDVLAAHDLKHRLALLRLGHSAGPADRAPRASRKAAGFGSPQAG
jgi:hypothetical protein